MKIHKLPKCCKQVARSGLIVESMAGRYHPALNLERYRAEQCFLPGCGGTQVLLKAEAPATSVSAHHVCGFNST